MWAGRSNADNTEEAELVNIAPYNLRKTHSIDGDRCHKRGKLFACTPSATRNKMYSRIFMINVLSTPREYSIDELLYWTALYAFCWSNCIFRERPETQHGKSTTSSLTSHAMLQKQESWNCTNVIVCSQVPSKWGPTPRTCE